MEEDPAEGAEGEWDGERVGDGTEATCAVCLESLAAPGAAAAMATAAGGGVRGGVGGGAGGGGGGAGGGRRCERAMMPCCEREGRVGIWHRNADGVTFAHFGLFECARTHTHTHTHTHSHTFAGIHTHTLSHAPSYPLTTSLSILSRFEVSEELNMSLPSHCCHLSQSQLCLGRHPA